MRIEQEGDYFVIAKGKPHYESYFLFFVDHDSSCWTSRNPEAARRYSTMVEADTELKELRHRDTLRRKERKKSTG